MKNTVTAAFVSLFFVGIGHAASAAEFEGTFGGVEIKRSSENSYSVRVFASVPGCIADLTGNGVVKGNTLQVKSSDDKTCVLSIVRTKKGIIIKENEACGQWHGGGCSFSGTYLK